MMVKLEDASAPACSTVFYLQNDCHDTMQQVCMTLNQRAEQFLVFFFFLLRSSQCASHPGGNNQSFSPTKRFQL